MNEIFQKIQEKLEKYPQVKTEIKKKHAIIYPTDETGFEIRVDVLSSKYIVSFNGWHEHFANIAEALNCIEFGLSAKCRLKVFIRGRFEYKWAVEFLENNHWKTASETGILLFPFWRKRKIKYFQNQLIKEKPK